MILIFPKSLKTGVSPGDFPRWNFSQFAILEI